MQLEYTSGEIKCGRSCFWYTSGEIKCGAALVRTGFVARQRQAEMVMSRERQGHLDGEQVAVAARLSLQKRAIVCVAISS